VPLNIGSRLDPVTEATTSIGQIYLYRWGVSDLNAFKNLSRETPDDRIRTILQHVSSLNSCGLSRKPLKDEEFNLFTDADLENLAKKYVACNPILALKSHQINQNSLKLTQDENESAMAFLNRNIDVVIHLNNQDGLRTMAKLANLSTEIRLESFRTYTEELELKFHQDKEALVAKQYSLLSGRLTTEERERVESDLSDDYYTIDELYIDQYRKSTLVSIYSFLEHSMNNLCNLCQKFYALPLGVKDLNGSGIERARAYLKMVIKINFEVFNAEWSELKDMNKIRNCIVHSDGFSKKLDKNIVNRTQGLSIKNHQLLIDRIYIDSSISTVECFLKKLYSETPLACKTILQEFTTKVK
jgi:hypothetical protein